MSILLKRLNNLPLAEITFIFAMMKKYGDLKIEEPTYKNKNKNKNRGKYNHHKKQKTIKNHDECTSKEPCLYDFDCPGWEKCDDGKFLQYKLIIEKCEK